MPVVSTPALILQTFAYGDTSRILRLLTPDYGLRSVIAKGARGARSRFGGVLEPFTEGEAQFNLREGRDLFTLSAFALKRSRQGIGRDLAAFTGAALLAEIALRVGTEEPNPELYGFMVRAFDHLADPAGQAEATALAAIWWLIGMVGFQPELEECVRCGRALDPEEATRFDVEGGGVVCQTCRPVGRLLEPPVRAEILRLSRGEAVSIPPSSRRVHAALLEAFLPTHLSPDRGLRSLSLFTQVLR